MRATQDLVQWDNSESGRSAQVPARWIVFVACLALTASAVLSYRVIGSTITAALAGAVAATVFVTACLPLPCLAFLAACLGCHALLGAVVAVVATGLRN